MSLHLGAPAGLPNPQDTVRIPAVADLPVLVADAAVRRVVVESGATIDVATYELTVMQVVATGAIIGTGVLVLAGDGATVEGTLPAVRVVGPAELTGATTAVGGLTIVGGPLALRGFLLTVGGQ